MTATQAKAATSGADKIANAIEATVSAAFMTAVAAIGIFGLVIAVAVLAS